SQSCTCNASWISFEALSRIGPSFRRRFGSPQWNWRSASGCSAFAAGLYGTEEAARGSSGSAKEGNHAGICRTDCGASGGGGRVRDRVRVQDWKQAAYSMEGLRRTRLGKSASCMAGSGTMIHITAQMRVLVDRVLDGAREAPLSESDHDKLKDALHALAAMLVRPRNTEKTSEVVEKPEDSEPGTQAEENTPPPPGHGRNGAGAFGGAEKVDIKHQKLTHGDRCPECGKGNVYGQKEPKVLVRIIGQAPLAATVYSLERLRCGACGQVFTAQEPEGVGPDKYVETAAAMIAQLKYGAGTPFYRLEQLGSQLGIPLPAATQWEIVEEAARVIKPARDELIRQAAQGSVVHNDDTSMRVLMLKRDPSDDRTGVFTSGIVSVDQGWKIALYFTGGRHAGENIAEV